MTDAADHTAEAMPFGRVVWRCRRGMKELDVLFERFARERYSSLSREQQLAFMRLLDLPDPELAEYLLGHVAPSDPSLAEIIRFLTGHRAGAASVS